MIAYGVYTLLFRLFKPESFPKLARMEEAFGKVAGYIMHLVGYSLVPIGCGVALLLK